MLDLKRIRFETDAVKQELAKRGDPDVAGQIDQVIALDAERRAVIQDVEGLKARRNQTSKEIADRKKAGEDAGELIAAMKEVSDRIGEFDRQLTAAEAQIEELLLLIPNTPLPEVPAGDESANESIRSWGEPLSAAPWRKPHWELGVELSVLDLERGARLSGSGFPVYTGLGARLQRALVNLMVDTHVREHGYREVTPPYLVRGQAMRGTGQLPKLADDAYQVAGDDDLWLIPTAEVPLTNLHGGEVLGPDDLPRRFVGYTPCFRREAGAAGRDTRGIIRVHQFDKVEMVRLERPEDSGAALDELTGHAERILQTLGLAYRVMLLAAGDMAGSSAMTYDLEVWSPGVERWLEVSSCSNCTDYQARRADIRFRREAGGKPEYVHTLNGSGLALPRTVIAVLENYQREDGSVELPEALHPYMGCSRIEP
ncbi:MAG: serine--tRNA ligase [Gemmatimonadetes bacterium]|uniref:Serine--tRNA ligase n=1 Tax=Candidatus Kutchimonas denitrificans TaxID=3056748 RepID=A0AAE5CA84_9BACT|nr:serine--tRNA ligase [Gemmatimonadota bacterium]NIR76231.1 serine--tRNA ligase [Candidatus Kutchimonas denitrificans]NIS00671.1 serine--tRNA ligase [Gemmatimonadota bacterium]NIT66816.1 serine--tRNA ligase [Gemmatimonadota bacterium]NIV23415.1 serine--tRNA ligase [Gemmatimonadota bacterium]